MINHETNHENSELSNENKSDRLVWPMDEKKGEKVLDFCYKTVRT